MAVILAYTSPAIGHLYPFCALLSELAARGHEVHVRTLDSGVSLCRRMGFAAEAVDPRIEDLQSEDWTTTSAVRVAHRTVQMLLRRAHFEVDDFDEALTTVRPHLALLDANCWGAISVAETQPVPWLVFSPFIPYTNGPGSPPFGPGFAPWSGPLGAIRDAGVAMVTKASFDAPVRKGLARLRSRLGLPPVRSARELLGRAPGVLVATGAPLQYGHTDLGDSIHMIGPAVFEPPDQEPPRWLDDIERPLVLVTTSSVRQADTELVSTAARALDATGLHIVATLPGGSGAVDSRCFPNATVTGFVPHSAVLARAVCVVTHGGMGVTQKALSRGIPVCVVPFGRDQFEVARRVEMARCGTRLSAKRLSVRRLRDKVSAAMAMTDGARAVADGFARMGGMRRGADLVEQYLGTTSRTAVGGGA